MKLIIRVGQCLGFGVLALAGSLGAQTPGVFQTNLTLRIMAANLTSGGPTYQTAGLNILKGLKPDIVAIQEFNYGNNSAADFRHMLDTTFGTNFVYYRESGYSIPNGIISRFPIRAAGSWDDSLVPDRGFAWARATRMAASTARSTAGRSRMNETRSAHKTRPRRPAVRDG